jgi:hypothetical protein
MAEAAELTLKLLKLGHADSYEDRPLADRCILGFNSARPAMEGR